jgi:hypothetical protein
MKYDLDTLKSLISKQLDIHEILDILGWDIPELLDVLEEYIEDTHEEFEDAID